MTSRSSPILKREVIPGYSNGEDSLGCSLLISLWNSRYVQQTLSPLGGGAQESRLQLLLLPPKRSPWFYFDSNSDWDGDLQTECLSSSLFSAMLLDTKEQTGFKLEQASLHPNFVHYVWFFSKLSFTFTTNLEVLLFLYIINIYHCCFALLLINFEIVKKKSLA